MARLTILLANVWRVARQWILLTCWLLAPLAGFCSAAAQSINHAVVEEQEVKAAYLIKFGSYVQWPEQTSISPGLFAIGVMDDDVIADRLIKIAYGRTVNGRPVVVRKMQRNDPVAGLNMLFIGGSNNVKLDEILAKTRGSPILTVTEFENAIASGSMINFLTIDGKIRFEVATKTAELNSLSISARLLAAAYKVMAGTS